MRIVSPPFRHAGLTISDLPNDEGFITSRNRYVTRAEGLKLQLEAGIKSVDPEGYKVSQLYSEDLY